MRHQFCYACAAVAMLFAACADENPAEPYVGPLALTSSASVEAVSSSDAVPALSSAIEAVSSSDEAVLSLSSSSEATMKEGIVVAECETSAQGVSNRAAIEDVVLETVVLRDSSTSTDLVWNPTVRDSLVIGPAPDYEIVKVEGPLTTSPVETRIIQLGIAPATYQLDIKKFMGPCDIRGAYAAARSGDTLKISFKEEIGMVNCICNMHLTFDIDPTDADVKFVKIGEQSFEVNEVVRPVVDPVITPSEISGAVYNSSTGDSQFALGACKANELDAQGVTAKGVANVKSFVAEKKSASIVNNGSGLFQVFIPSASDYCCVNGASILLKREGDVLSISYDVAKAAVCKCICVMDHWFDIPAEYADVKTVEFNEVLYEILR